MIARYHRLMTIEALQGEFSESALKVIVRSNLGQDNIRGQIGHPEFHFDDSQIKAATEYIELQRRLVVENLDEQQVRLISWEAFGRLTHAAQDFYAHTNYIKMWLEQNRPANNPADIDFWNEQLINNPALFSGRFYVPREPLSMLPLVGKYFKNGLPRDSHAWMNLDSPERGHLFEYARQAAIKRTRFELQKTVKVLENQPDAARKIASFRDLSG